MKKIITLFTPLLLSVFVWAQAPQMFGYQMLIRNEGNVLVINQKVSIRISILHLSDAGSIIYSEIHSPTTNTNGLASFNIGGGTILSGDFTKIDWSKGPYFVKSETDILGGSNYQISSVRELMSVPYTLNALNSQPGIKGVKGDKGPQGLKGNTGPQGPQGPAGDTSNIKLRVSFTGDTLEFEKGSFLIIPGISLLNHKPTSGYGPRITDIDGNSYKTVYIGTQHWMAENLKVSMYKNFDKIPNIKDMSMWTKTTSPAWCNYNNNDSLGKIYGKIYNFYSILYENICPVGWHVPSADEWSILINYLGGEKIAGSKMKDSISGGSNTSMFSALTGGVIPYVAQGDNLGGFWSTTVPNPYKRESKILLFTSKTDGVGFSGSNYTTSDHGSFTNGYSIRCLKD